MVAPLAMAPVLLDATDDSRSQGSLPRGAGPVRFAIKPAGGMLRRCLKVPLQTEA